MPQASPAFLCGGAFCLARRRCGLVWGYPALRGGAFCLARRVFPGLLRAVALRPEPAGRRCGARAGCRFRSEAAAGCGSRRSLRSAGRFSRAVFVVVRRFLPPASCFLPPASRLLPPASCFPPSAVETGRTVKNSGKHPEKGCFPFGCRSELGGWPDGWWYGGFFRLSGASVVPAAPARLALRGLPLAAVLLSAAPYFLPFTFHFSLSVNPCEMKVRIGSRPVRQ